MMTKSPTGMSARGRGPSAPHPRVDRIGRRGPIRGCAGLARLERSAAPKRPAAGVRSCQGAKSWLRSIASDVASGSRRDRVHPPAEGALLPADGSEALGRMGAGLLRRLHDRQHSGRRPSASRSPGLSRFPAAAARGREDRSSRAFARDRDRWTGGRACQLVDGRHALVSAPGAERQHLFGVGFYFERYRRDPDDVWRILELRLRRVRVEVDGQEVFAADRPPRPEDP